MEKRTWLFLAIILFSVHRERIKQFQTNVESLSPFLSVLNAHSHVFNFTSDISEDKPNLVIDVKPFNSCFLCECS